MARKLRLLAVGGSLLALGLGYAVWVRSTGLAVPCLFHAVSGLLCPGCGVTRMCLALLRWDWAEAWDANPVLLLMLPVLTVMGIRIAARFVRENGTVVSEWENALLWTMTALLAIWGVVRNLL